MEFSKDITTSGSINYAGFWIRLGAIIIDFIILCSLLCIIVCILVSMPHWWRDYIQFLGILWWLIVIVSLTGFTGKFGATPGKMAFALKVVRPDGQKVGYARACTRVLVGIVSAVTLFGYIIQSFDRKRRTLHDYACDTRVVICKAEGEDISGQTLPVNIPGVQTAGYSATRYRKAYTAVFTLMVAEGILVGIGIGFHFSNILVASYILGLLNGLIALSSLIKWHPTDVPNRIRGIAWTVVAFAFYILVPGLAIFTVLRVIYSPKLPAYSLWTDFNLIVFTRSFNEHIINALALIIYGTIGIVLIMKNQAKAKGASHQAKGVSHQAKGVSH